jgi:hydroxymethylbilane synthase
LGLDNRIAHYLPCERFVPDAGQGIIALQTRAGTEIEEMVRAVSDQESEIAARAERATVRALNADCRSPVGAYAEVSEGAVRVLGMAADRDGSKLVRATEVGSRETAESVGTRLGLRLLHLLEGGRTEGVPAT